MPAHLQHNKILGDLHKERTTQPFSSIDSVKTEPSGRQSLENFDDEPEFTSSFFESNNIDKEMMVVSARNASNSFAPMFENPNAMYQM